MKARYVFAVVTAMSFAPLALNAQTQTTTQDEAAARSRISASLETAVKAGIPVDLLKSKVAEGRAKGVSEARIAAAVEARLKGLTRASEAMKRAEVENTTAADLSVSADALEAGVSESSLIKITREAPAERRAVAIATLTGLVQLGHASDRALARVSAVVRSNAGLGKLNADVSSQLQSRGRVGVGGGVVDGTLGVVGKGRVK